MNSNNTCLKIMLLTLGCLFSAGLYAQEEGMLEEEAQKLPPLYTSEVELGAGYSSADSFKFGEYNGLEDEGAFAIGNFSLRKYSTLDDGDPNYWEFSGSNVGLDNRNVYLEYSHDGTYGNYSGNSGYRAYFEYDQIPHNQFEDGRTPFNGAGTTSQTLPSTWSPIDGPDAGNVRGNVVSELDDLIPNLKSVELETERQRFGGGLKWHLADNWLAQATYRHEIKDGSDPIGAIFGSSGGNPRASILAVPINYDVDEFDAGLAYTGDKGQYSLNYHLSLFDNNDNSVLWDNPFNNCSAGQWTVGACFSDRARGQLGLFPDNQAHQINLTAGYNFSPKMRGTANISYSRWLQDQTYLPFSNVFPATVLPLPRNSLDGDIETVHANFNFFTRLTNELDVKARYTLEDRNNDTPRDAYLRMPGDATRQNAAGLLSDQARVNWTYDLTRHLLELEGGYRLAPMTNLEAGYAYERKERNLSEVENTDEHTVKIRVSASPLEAASGWVKYQHSFLDGSDYVSNEPLLTGHTPEHIDDVITNDCGGVVAGCSDLFENDFLMRKLHFANRDRDQVQAAINFYPYEKLDFTFSAEYRQDDFDNTEIGLQNSRNYNATIDVNFHPNKRFNAYIFATHENFKYDQRGYRRDGDAFGPGDPRPTPAGDDEDFWTTDTEDTINMVGAGFDWFVIEDKFKVNLDFTYSRANTEFDQWSGPRLTGGNVAVQLPDVTTRLTNLSLTGEYQIRENVKARLKYMYERFHSADFGLDRVNVNTLTNVILLGNGSPEYVDHAVGVSFVYEYQ